MSYTIVPRTDIGLPAVVTSSGGNPRPHLGPDNQWLTWHYTGVSSRGYETSDVAREVRRIQEIFEATKPFEYNWVIGQNEDDLIYEFAGDFQAAHSAGENHDAVGILFLNATFEPLTPTQIQKARWVRDLLILRGILRADVVGTPHRHMPDAQTQCPGDLIMFQLPELAKPYQPPEEDPVAATISYIVIPPSSRSGQDWLVVIDGQVRPATSYDLGKGLPQWQMSDKWAAQQYDSLRKAAGLD